jgi:hypothetical protein
MTSNGQGPIPRPAAGGTARRAGAAARSRHGVGTRWNVLAAASPRPGGGAARPGRATWVRAAAPAVRQCRVWHDQPAVEWVRAAIQGTFQ